MADVTLVAGDPAWRRIVDDRVKHQRLCEWVAAHDLDPDDVERLSIENGQVTFTVYVRGDGFRQVRGGHPLLELRAPVPVVEPWPFQPWSDYAEPVRTPKPWPPGIIPRPEQLAAWLKACTDDERLDYAQRWSASVQAWGNCYQADHEGTIEHLRRLCGKAAEHVDATGAGLVVKQALELEARTGG